MKGYWRDPGTDLRPFFVRGLTSCLAATAKVLTTDGWLMSGDIGFQDEEGFVYVRDRSESLNAQSPRIHAVRLTTPK
jgi:acyl-CoA synthetase (AMP-forming)/AMP-acid ligase II